MIYEYPDEHEPLRQGDIFYPLPLMVINLGQLVVLSEQQMEESDWEAIKDKKDTVVSVPLKPVWGIVASQDCDVSRTPIISLFVIGTLAEVTRLTLPTSDKKWVSFITQKSRLNARWLYLPNNSYIGFEERMAVNFEIVFQIRRVDLEENIAELRKGRLNQIAYEHYRERIAQYFRRYPYDEWYPLTKQEFEEYDKQKGPVEPFEWQK